MKTLILNNFVRNQITAIQYLGLATRNMLSSAKLQRRPEPHRLTEQPLHVDDYSRAIDSVMILPYILVLDMIHRVRGGAQIATAIDLCCGPGHFTRMLIKNLNCGTAVGVDLSEPMLAKAAENARRENLSTRATYLWSDVTNLKTVQTQSMDVVTFMDAAHHMDTIDQVRSVLVEANRVAKPDGVIAMIDPVRPKTVATAESYHHIAGQAYVDLGLKYFNQDFRDSIYASWSTSEMFDAIPKGTRRKWVQIIPFGFPSFQIVIGLPEGQDQIFMGKSLPESEITSLVPVDSRADWRMLRFSFALAQTKFL